MRPSVGKSSSTLGAVKISFERFAKSILRKISVSGVFRGGTHCWNGVERIQENKKATNSRGFFVLCLGARSWTRTSDPLINSQVL